MSAVYALSPRSIDQLETDIIGFATQLNATEYQFLELLREFDIRRGWEAYHFNNCAEWLNMKCGIVVGTAREKVRVATALFDLTGISKAFSDGDLSYSKVRSLSRVATPHNEKVLLEYALRQNAQQVQDHCQKLRNANRVSSTRTANQIHKQRYMSRSLHDDGSMTITLQLSQESGELLMKTIEQVVAKTAFDYTGNPSRDGFKGQAEESLFAKQADALIEIVEGYLAGGSEKTTSSADHHQVVVHVDEAALREAPNTEAKSDLPLESVRRLCCDTSIVAITEDKQGNPLDVGRKHRIVQPALRRALLSRDKCCKYPGCTHDKWLDAQGLPRFIGYHVKHWIDGGETKLDNTLLLCSKHHRLLHEGGFTIRKNYQGQWYFQTDRGRVVG